jgi:hypothetical protein
MNKYYLYFIFIFIFLLLSKYITSPETELTMVDSVEDFSRLLPTDSPSTIFLKDYFVKGEFIKSHFFKITVVSTQSAPQDKTIRITKDFAHHFSRHLGMTLCFKRKKNSPTYYNNVPPGSNFIGELSIGYWDKTPNGNIWKFYSSYSYFNQVFGWNDFTPTQEFFNKFEEYTKEKRSFWGLNNEFGRDGIITQKNFPEYFVRQTEIKSQWKQIGKIFFSFDLNFFNNHLNF